MEPSHQVLRRTLEKVGVKALALRLRVSPSLVYKWCAEKDGAPDDPPAGGACNPLDRLKAIYELTGDPAVIQWICALADGFFVPNPQPQKGRRDGDVLHSIQRLIKEFSETLDAISKAYNHGRRIDRQEAVSIRKEWEDLKSTGEMFVLSCEQGHFAKARSAKHGS